MSGPDKDSRTHSKRPKWVELLIVITGTTLVLLVLSSVALLIYTEGSRDPTVQVIDIPPGTGELIEQGENPLEIRSTLFFYADDTLVLNNRDDVAHTLGSWFVQPNTETQFDLQPASGGYFSSSLLPSGRITLDIQPRDFDFSIIVFPVLIFGFAIGFVLWIGLNVMRSLDREPDVSMYLDKEDGNPESVDRRG
ncbi:MAG: hypothetical protein BMS9Abin12_2260 [Acidimicrobiia bacterium]|nr:MAG: hypothetical protein BMS9Abin12_2260 [Acidimicrobiia bacterium]